MRQGVRVDERFLAGGEGLHFDLRPFVADEHRAGRAQRFGELELFADFHRGEREIHARARVAQPLHQRERVRTTLLFRDDDVNIAGPFAREPRVHLRLRRGCFVDQVREHDIAHAEAKRGQIDFAVAHQAEELVVAAPTGQGALANARHAFADGRGLAQRAVDLDAFNATAKGVLVDSLLELGEYDAALGVLQEMVDLKPGVASFTRVSYSYELRGDVEGATYALTRALEVAQSAPDIAFVQLQLGDLAYGTGDYATAGSHYADGLRGDPANVPLLAGQARVSAAVGDVDAALAGFAAVVQRLPQLTYLVEHGELLDSVGRADEAQAQYDVVDVEQTLSGAAGVQTDIEVALYDADHGSPADALRVAEAQYATRRSVQVEDALAWALHANGRSAEALPHALAAQQLGTRNALWDYHRGMIQLALGLTDDARASLTAALELHPAFSALHAPLARTALNGLGAGPVDDAVDGPVDGGVDGPVDGAVVAP